MQTKVDDLLKTLYTMAFLVEARDAYTGGHLWRVSQFATRLAVASGLSRKEVAAIGLGGFLHDLGKVGVPDAILGKTDKLSDAEYGIIKTHPDVGIRVLYGHPLIDFVQEAIIGHHERPDGCGYPHGISNESLGISARIIGLVDAFDAMTSSRPYRKGMPLELALEQITINAGTQFDKKFSKIFIELGRKGELDDIIGHSDSGIPMRDCPMCGRVVTGNRNLKDVDAVYCRVCCNGHNVLFNPKTSLLEPTGDMQRGMPTDLIADIDHTMLAKLIDNTAPYLFVGKTQWWNWREQKK